MSEPSLYERVLASVGASGAAAGAFPVTLRASAAVVLWRSDPDGAPDGGLQVFWLRRKPEMKFMGGWHAFPGGTVSREDAAESAGWIAGAPRGLDPDATTGALPETLTEGLDPAPDDVPGLLVATFRELFEETGLLPTADGLVGRSERFEAARADLLAGQRSIARVAEDLGVEVDASRQVFAGRWITPPLAPLRFDNRFFLLEHSTGAPEPAVPDEAAEAGWVRPEEAIALWRRGEVIAAPPILYILRALAEAHSGSEGGLDGRLEAALPRLREPTDANLGPYRRIDFRPGVVMIPVPTPTLPPASHTNAYLVGPPEGGEAVLVDPGTPFPREIERLEAAVRAAAEDEHRPLRLTAIWLTHHHGDHVGAVRHLAERFGVPVAAHAETADRLDARSAEPIRVDRTIEDGELFDLDGLEERGGITLRALHTPGHAPGHLCFYEEELGSLLAGDMLSAVSTIVVDPPDGDMDRYLASLERLAALDPRAIFPGHGPAILGGADKLRELIQHRLWREAKVLEAWRAGARRPADMLPTVYDDAPRQVWPLAERQIEAHLQRLARAGTIDRRSGARAGS
jgi:glyoxylase-like metal-dependent hydrolase (beta-lactamase superfamily II)